MLEDEDSNSSIGNVSQRNNEFELVVNPQGCIRTRSDFESKAMVPTDIERPNVRKSMSTIDVPKRKVEVGAVNLPSLMNIDNVQYTTLKKLRHKKQDDTGDEATYGSPGIHNNRGAGKWYNLIITFSFSMK